MPPFLVIRLLGCIATSKVSSLYFLIKSNPWEVDPRIDRPPQLLYTYLDFLWIFAYVLVKRSKANTTIKLKIKEGNTGIQTNGVKKMKFVATKTLALLMALMLLSLAACSSNPKPNDAATDPVLSDSETMTSTEPSQSPNSAAAGNASSLARFADVRGGFFTGDNVLSPSEYKAEDIYTYQFNEHTVFTGNETLRQEIMENGKNPGLGIRALHEKGITGEGVSVAIIDESIFLEPTEFADRIVDYYECHGVQSQGGMHGNAVTSILAGKTCGVAPSVKVYYVAAPSGLTDSTYWAEGLNWIIDKNESLPEKDKIRVVSVSANLSGTDCDFENQEKWEDAVARAKAAGILVISCSVGTDTHFTSGGYYDYADPDNIEKARNGWWSYGQSGPEPTQEGVISVPVNFRTTVEQYDAGDFFFRYGGQGGESWGVPYAAGVLALGWQINPQLSPEEIKKILIDSAYENQYGERIIYPSAFIEMVENTL